MKMLDLSDDVRRTIPGDSLAIDRAGNEIFVGLERPDSDRYALLVSGPVTLEERRKITPLEERHKRAMVLWKIINSLPGFPSTGPTMSADEAFTLGYEAYKPADASKSYNGFRQVIGDLPTEFRLAALNGWLQAFDDLASKLGVNQSDP